MAEQDMTLDAGKITNSAFILHDVLYDHEKHVFIKNTHKLFNFAVHVLNVYFLFTVVRTNLHLAFLLFKITKPYNRISASRHFAHREVRANTPVSFFPPDGGHNGCAASSPGQFPLSV